ncbi:hypothetical protein [Microbacterium trichothecenolyticum]|uniref:hypothetical protein n=1 Tax=Microbacterium trichothecenolyticum TaxID=69370 RepID=UPI003F7606A6
MTLHKTPTPPMGWNSWDCYGTTVTEAEVLANAEFMAAHLLRHGWDTIVVDIDWADPTARAHGYNESAPLVLDENGRVQPDPVRFPSAAGGAGFGPLAERIHELGLKFGIHIMRGIPRIAVDRVLPVRGAVATAADIADPANACEWNPHYVGLDHRAPGAAAYYRSIAEQYARWGVDFIKADDMLWPYQAAEIEALAAAIEAAPRQIALSLSPGRDLSAAHLEHLRAHATMWRICDDLWDRWDDVEANFARLARWAPLAGPDGWPDADMLPLGRIGIRAERGEPREGALTLAERRTLVTLWVMARSPPDDRRRPADERARDDRAVHQRRGARDPPRLHRQPRAAAGTRPRHLGRRTRRHPLGCRLQHRRPRPRGAFRHPLPRARSRTGRRHGRVGRGIRSRPRRERTVGCRPQRRPRQLCRADLPRAARVRPPAGVTGAQTGKRLRMA